jgi:cytochrome c oxidase cbb3-type subunit 4
MDINVLRETLLLLGLGAFVGIVLWAYGSGRKSRFERAASIVFQDDAHDALSVAQALARARRTGEGE